MPADAMGGDRAAVLAVVQAFFGDDESRDQLVWGPLRDWSDLIGEVPWAKRYESRHVLEHAEIDELTPTRAVVEVRAWQTSAVIRGARTDEFRFDGLAVLEKVDGAWRLVDFTLDGRRRLQSIVLGSLAVQENRGVTVRVLGVDRTTRGTHYVVELVNSGPDEIRVERGYGLFETETAWARLSLDSEKLIPAGESDRLLLSTANAVELSETLMAIALRVRSGSRGVPFRLKVPVTPPETPIPQQPPMWLPLMRSTWPRSLVFYAALTVAAAWWYGWLAIVVLLFVGLTVYRSVRAGGYLPEWLYPARHAVDLAVALCAFLILWETAVNLAVPAAVAALVYLALRPLGRKRAEARVALALTAGAAWLFLLGLNDGPLSPCRIADGTPASTADRFAHALFTGNLERVHSYAPRPLWVLDRAAPGPMSARAADGVVARRSGVKTELGRAWCAALKSYRVVGCYWYPLEWDGRRVTLGVAIGCEGHDWRVDSWIPST